MKVSVPLCVLAGALVAAVGAPASAVSFEPPEFTIGTRYGRSAGQSPGDFVFTSDAVSLSLEDFTLGSFTTFSRAVIAGYPGPPVTLSPGASMPTESNDTAVDVPNTQSLMLNNISVRAHLATTPVNITRAGFTYFDYGGEENLAVNNLARHAPSRLVDLAGDAAFAGFTVHVAQTPMASGVRGSVEVVAHAGHAIESLTIGGQELVIDDFYAVPAPAAATVLGLFLMAAAAARHRDN